MGFTGVALDLRDEPVLVLRAGVEPAIAMKHPVHGSSRRG